MPHYVTENWIPDAELGATPSRSEKAALGTQVHATAAPNSLVRTIRVHILTLTDLVRVTATLRQLGPVESARFPRGSCLPPRPSHIEPVTRARTGGSFRMNLAKRRAVSAVTARFPWTISLIRRGGTPMETASLCWVIPISLRKSSMRISPG